MTIFQKIRSACSAVAEVATDVHIDGDRIKTYADTLSVDRLQQPVMDDAHHLVGSGSDTVAYIITLDAINFGSGYFPELRPRQGLSDYFLIARALRDRFQDSGPFTADDLRQMTSAKCAQIFGQSLHEPGPRELMEKFAQAWRSLGIFLINQFHGEFAGPVEAAEHRACALVETLSEIPEYRDVAVYSGVDVPLYKRAQITVADLHLAMGGDGLGRFTDIDKLTIFADNQVPHVLRIDGVLNYSEKLARTIDASEHLAPGSPQEIEIRACGLHAVELLVARLRRDAHAVTAMAVDNYLWHLGESPRYKTRLMHRTRTFFY